MLWKNYPLALIKENKVCVSDQVDALQKRAADLKSSFDQARQETQMARPSA
jgi:hypothetical protein